MVVQISFPDALKPAMDTFMQGQTTSIGGTTYFKYADYQDLVQQNFNDGLGVYFTGKLVDALIAPLQAQIDALKATLQLTPPKTPVPAVTP